MSAVACYSGSLRDEYVLADGFRDREAERRPCGRRCDSYHADALAESVQNFAAGVPEHLLARRIVERIVDGDENSDESLAEQAPLVSGVERFADVRLELREDLAADDFGVRCYKFIHESGVPLVEIFASIVN